MSASPQRFGLGAAAVEIVPVGALDPRRLTDLPGPRSSS